MDKKVETIVTNGNGEWVEDSSWSVSSYGWKIDMEKERGCTDSGGEVWTRTSVCTI
tara:strand:- start:380 stop:547 length:168 start_codon:yes stop_codon:yes gene_type:complete